MRFASYPTAADRRARVNARVLVGDVISQAPPSGQWVYVQDEGKFYRVFGAADHQGGLRSAIDTEAYMPRGAKTAG